MGLDPKFWTKSTFVPRSQFGRSVEKFNPTFISKNKQTTRSKLKDNKSHHNIRIYVKNSKIREKLQRYRKKSTV